MLYNKLYDWQKKIVDMFKDRQAYGLFLDMGLGKTPLSLAMCEANKCDKIIIITLNAKATESEDIKGSWLWWANEMEYKYKLLNKKNLEFDDNSKEILLINYEWLLKRPYCKKEGVKLRDEMISFIKSCYGKKVGIICDESHKLKSSESAQYKCFNKLYTMLNNHSKTRLYLLSGTPFTQGYLDLYTQLKLLGINITKTSFKERFCILGNVKGLLGWQQPVVAYKNLDELYNLIHSVAITIKSSEVIDLPKQIFIEHTYPMTKSMKLFINEKATPKDIKSWGGKILYSNENKKIPNLYYRNLTYPEFTYEAETSSQFWLRTRELSIGFLGNSESYNLYDMTRFNMIEKFLKENEDNYLLFYSYTPEFLELYEICDKLGYSIDVYNGIIKDTKNYDKWANLTENERFGKQKKSIILTNWNSGSTGINFQCYDKCIIFDLPVYRDWEQGLKRIHRIGQKNTCIYHLFMQNCWLDKGMKKAIDEKRDYNTETFESDLNRVKDILEG